ncbi:PleD family two-component system response regulator [candidate division CSSED10-310 bacterium]|uniref:PleD family two-component system response regulator n=1 Tax=candidate division CSSED10-310 bacterium TaxID=2855610 RepID=A0ABV6YWS3_UNCC1
MSEKKTVILAVDDNENVIELIKETLEGEDYDVISTTRGADALEIALKSTPDLILLDLIMPDVDGLKVLKSMRKRPEFSQTPIVFLTATKDEKTVKQGEKYGVTVYLTKPFSPLLLIKRVKSILDS